MAKRNAIISYKILTLRRILNHKAVYRLLSASLDILNREFLNIPTASSEYKEALPTTRYYFTTELKTNMILPFVRAIVLQRFHIQQLLY
jgi:hypothetical protein